MSRRSVRTETKTITTSRSNTNKDLDELWLLQEEFESATYSHKYVDGQVISPNLSRRRLYVDQSGRDSESSSHIVKSSASSAHVRVYGKRIEQIANTNSSSQQSHTNGHVEVSETAFLNNNNSNNEITSANDEVLVISMAKSQKIGARGRGKSPSRNIKKTVITQYDDEVDSESLSRGDSSHASTKSANYVLSSGLDEESERVTERSSTVIDTVATGSPLAVKVLGCILFIYGCVRILINRLWYGLGYPVYATLQQYLLLDTWLLSRAATQTLRKILICALLLLLPLALIFLSMCGLHAYGLVNVTPCAPITGVYYVTHQSDIDAPGLSVRLREKLNYLFFWKTEQSSHNVVLSPNNIGPVVDWNEVIEEKMSKLLLKTEGLINSKVATQQQKNTDIEIELNALKREYETQKKSDLDKLRYLTELANLKSKLSELETLVASHTKYKELISSTQEEIIQLQQSLGVKQLPVKLNNQDGLMLSLYNEISQLKKNIDKLAAERPTPVCPDSHCVCESDLNMLLIKLKSDIMGEVNERNDRGATVYISSNTSSNLNEQFVKKMILDELDIFAADGTGMPDFALQSMGAQVISTRCSQTYYQESGLMSYFGIPLYHLHKDPSVVIQPGTVPGECWCFHGSSGSLVIELADNVIFNSFSLEHISAKQSVNGEILSAPKEVEVYGLTSEQDTAGTKLGQWTYNKNGPRLQFFPVQKDFKAFHIVELRVLSNWGNPEFTCLYRFRVHGKLAPK